MKDMLSSYGTFLSGYYGIWLQLNFKDGSTSQYDMIYREGSGAEAKLTAFFLEFVDMDTVESIQVGGLIVPLE